MWLKQNSGYGHFLYTVTLAQLGPTIYIPHLLDPSRTGGPQPPGHRPVPVPGPLGAGGGGGRHQIPFSLCGDFTYGKEGGEE